MIRAEQFAEKSRVPIDEKWGYILGKRGQVWTQRDQNAATDEMIVKYGKKWVGRRVADCSGLVKWALIELGSNCAHGSNSIWKGYLKKKGTTSDHQMKDGEVVFKFRKTDGKDDYYHIGVYDGGYVNQAQSTANGCRRTKFDSSWTHWGQLKDIDYSGESVDPEDREAFHLGEYEVTAKSGKTVRMRKNPNKNAGIVTEVPVGAKVRVVEDTNEQFAEIEYTIKGYMMKDFLKGV